jgi:translation initiation factor IF-1
MVEKTDEKPVSGVVIDALPNLTFKVELSDGSGTTTLAYVSGKMRLHRIKVLVGDKVELVLAPDGVRGRITRRL